MPLQPDHFWHYQPAPQHDLRQQLAGFDELENVCEEDQQLARLLAEGNATERAIGKQLAGCRDGRRCLLPVCRKCRRRYRLWLAAAMVRLLGEGKGLLFVTLIPRDERLPPGRLHKFSPRRLIERLKRQLARSGLGHVVVIGGVDLSFNVDSDGKQPARWEPHLHLIVAGCSKEQLLAALRRHYRPSKEVRAPLRIQRLANWPKQFSYTTKPFFGMKMYFTNDAGMRRPARRRLPPERAREISRVLSRYSNNDLRMLVGVRQHGTELRYTAGNSKRNIRMALQAEARDEHR